MNTIQTICNTIKEEGLTYSNVLALSFATVEVAATNKDTYVDAVLCTEELSSADSRAKLEYLAGCQWANDPQEWGCWAHAVARLVIFDMEMEASSTLTLRELEAAGMAHLI